MSDQSDPTIIVIFGISGDLAGRKVLPALYRLLKHNLLPNKCRIIGTSRQEITVDKILDKIELSILETDNDCDPAVLKRFKEIFEVIQFDPSDEKGYALLKNRLDKIEVDEGVCLNRLFYLAIPPAAYLPIVRLLGKNNLSGSCQHNKAKSRLLIEKPFGYDLDSAKRLIKQTNRFFKEDQILRIDHYLAKETAQNILAFRRHNPLFCNIWQNNYISKVTIRALETLGIEGRVGFYESTGALRDIIQSHLLQLMAISAMELPDDINSSNQIHQQKIKLLNKVVIGKLTKQSILRGQYTSYREEVNNPKSNTETYVLLKFGINNKRWANTPFILETGKAMAKKTTDVTIDFAMAHERNRNQLTIRIQPNEGIDIKLFAKKPGFSNTVEPTIMDFSYESAFKDQARPDAYERVMVDALRGDQSLFASDKEVIRSWQILQPILDKWQRSSDDLMIYPNGSMGPANNSLK